MKQTKLFSKTFKNYGNFGKKKNAPVKKAKAKKKACFEKIGFNRFFKRQEECRNMSHNNLDTWIKGQLASFAYSDNSTTQNRIKYQYRYDNQNIVYLSTYLILITISSCRLDRNKAHIKNNEWLK
ncbi:hypothetical protein C2G38_2222344 [Gigaspora rosea]|uniref:Uncharacterized protein n=1 Tax=Gigaspora rosea TaxID=44941 RepID=A0A397UBC9_9GLOM|nr:hypothetical protein C2G38_2222344 [Gigaspora rosea]